MRASTTAVPLKIDLFTLLVGRPPAYHASIRSRVTTRWCACVGGRKEKRPRCTFKRQVSSRPEPTEQRDISQHSPPEWRVPPNGGACPPPHFQGPRICHCRESHCCRPVSMETCPFLLAGSICCTRLLRRPSILVNGACTRRPTNTHCCWLQEDGHLYPHRDRSHPPTAFVSRNAHLASTAGWLVHTQKRVVYTFP